MKDIIILFFLNINRWIRYEEDYDFEIERWQAPRIGCLNFHSLLELRRGLQYGAQFLF